jgi:transposase-like protein
MKLRFNQSLSGTSFSASPGQEREFGVSEPTEELRKQAIAEAKRLIASGHATEVVDTTALLKEISEAQAKLQKEVEALQVQLAEFRSDLFAALADEPEEIETKPKTPPKK